MYLVVLIDGYLDKYGSDFSVAGIYSTYDKALDAIEKLCNKDKIIIDEKDRKDWNRFLSYTDNSNIIFKENFKILKLEVDKTLPIKFNASFNSIVTDAHLGGYKE